MNFGALRMLGNLAGRLGLANSSGITFGGKRDLFAVLGYKRVLEIDDFRQRYRRGGIAGRVVDTFPDATWREGAEIYEDDDPERETEFEIILSELDKRIPLWPVFHRADILSCLGRYSGIVIGAPGDMKDPLVSLDADEISYLSPYAEDDLKIDRWDEDPKSERYGEPIAYKLQRTVGNKSPGAGAIVHWTRVIHVVMNQLDDRVYGAPSLERVWNYLDDLDKVVGSGSEAFWKRVDQGMLIKLDPDKEIDDEENKKMLESADAMVHGLRRIMMTYGAETEMLGSDVANFNSQVDAVITLIAGACEIPKRILVGSERGELASTQDKTTFDERVADRRTESAEPNVVRKFVGRLTTLGALPEVEEYYVFWPEASQLDDRGRLEIATKAVPLIAPGVLTAEEIRDTYLGLEPLEEEDVELTEENVLEVDGVPSPPPNGEPAPEDDEDEDEEPKPKAAMKALIAQLKALGLRLPKARPARVARGARRSRGRRTRGLVRRPE